MSTLDQTLERGLEDLRQPMATHTDADLERALLAFAEAGKEVGVI